jgi:hypothetical protein
VAVHTVLVKLEIERPGLVASRIQAARRGSEERGEIQVVGTDDAFVDV